MNTVVLSLDACLCIVFRTSFSCVSYFDAPDMNYRTFSLLSFISEWREGFWKLTRGRWEVTRVVTKRELGKPAQRLMEQTEKLPQVN